MPGHSNAGASNAAGRGSRPPVDISIVLDKAEPASSTKTSSLSREKVWALVCREARAVSFWALLSPLIRLAFAPLLSQATVSSSCSSEDTSCSAASNNLSTLARWLLALFPRTVAQDLAPGFMFASVWLLFAVCDHFGVVPNVPIRICETVMGRMTVQELFIVLPVHFVCALSTFTILKLVLLSTSDSLASMALSPIVYSNANAWLVDFIREVAVTCAFAVAFLVLPELFALNKVPRFLTAAAMYPLYSIGVDSSGKGSTFGPNALFALAAVGQRSGNSNDDGDGLGQSTSRFVGVILGGILGGIIMRRYFPDDPRA